MTVVLGVVWGGVIAGALPGPGRAQTPEPEAPAASLGDAYPALLLETERAWVSGRGRAYAAQRGAEGRALGREPGALESLSFEVAPEVSPGANLRTELAVGVGLGFRLLGVGHRARDAANRLALIEAEAEDARLAFAEQVFVRYGEWAAAELHARHLIEHLDEYERDLAPLRLAVERRQLDALTLETLEVELVRLGLELETARSHAAHAAASISVLLGKATDPAKLGALPTGPLPSSWSEVATERHPELLRLAAESRRETTAGELARRVDDPLMVVAATARRVGDPDESHVFGGVSVSLTVPLSRAGGAEAERHAGRALALSETRALRATTLALELAQHEAQHGRWLAELQRLRGDAEPRLMRRAERIEAAMRAGRASASDLVLARRDLIELHHAEVSLIGRLVASGLLSKFWKDALGLRESGEGVGR